MKIRMLRFPMVNTLPNLIKPGPRPLNSPRRQKGLQVLIIIVRGLQPYSLYSSFSLFPAFSFEKPFKLVAPPMVSYVRYFWISAILYYYCLGLFTCFLKELQFPFLGEK